MFHAKPLILVRLVQVGAYFFIILANSRMLKAPLVFNFSANQIINSYFKLMKQNIITYCLFTVLISSCATLNISEINNLEKTKFESMSLVPDMEVNNLRIDLIRQTYEANINDSTKETKETPYHPIGFNLGNGLFYDLNENLCLRLDYILGFSSNSNFEIQKINRPEKNKGITTYKFINDSLLVQYPPRKKTHYDYHRVSRNDSTLFMYKKRLLYAIVETDSSLIYTGKRRKLDAIYKTDDNNYYLNKKRWKENYQIKDNDIFLENDYVVSLTNNDSRIEVKRNRRTRNDRVLYTIEKNNERIYVYNKDYSGLLIVIEENSVLVYRNNDLLRKYEIKEGADRRL